jgi:hypothetical protein
MEKHQYIMVVDSVEKMALILRHALGLEEVEYSTNDSSLDESSIVEKTTRLLHMLPRMREAGTTSVSPLSPRETDGNINAGCQRAIEQRDR